MFELWKAYKSRKEAPSLATSVPSRFAHNIASSYNFDVESEAGVADTGTEISSLKALSLHTSTINVSLDL